MKWYGQKRTISVNTIIIPVEFISIVNMFTRERAFHKQCVLWDITKKSPNEFVLDDKSLFHRHFSWLSNDILPSVSSQSSCPKRHSVLLCFIISVMHLFYLKLSYFCMLINLLLCYSPLFFWNRYRLLNILSCL